MTPAIHATPHQPQRIAQAFGVLALLVLGASTAAWGLATDPAQGVRMVIRLTARTSFTLFLLAWMASTLVRLHATPLTRWLRLHRRAFGLAFAFSQLTHLVAIAAFARLDPQAFAHQASTANVITGGLAYVFTALMAASSWDGAVRWLGLRRWQLLHTVGAYYLWISFVVSFGKRMAVSPAYAAPVTLLVACLLLRMVAGRWKLPAT